MRETIYPREPRFLWSAAFPFPLLLLQPTVVYRPPLPEMYTDAAYSYTLLPPFPFAAHTAALQDLQRARHRYTTTRQYPCHPKTLRRALSRLDITARTNRGISYARGSAGVHLCLESALAPASTASPYLGCTASDLQDHYGSETRNLRIYNW